MTAPATITAEERDALLAADLRNVTEKVASGAVLTARERSLITGSTRADEPSGFAASLDEISAALGLSERQWRTYSKKPGFPEKTAGKGWDVAAVAAWKEANVKQQQASKLSDVKKEAEIILLNLRIDREKRLSVPRAEVDELHGRLAMRLKAFLYSRLVNEMPQKVAGAEALAIRVYAQATVDEIVAALARDIDSWGASEVTPAAKV